MSIHNLRVNGCRILSHIEIEPSATFNFILGPNGSGKSSLLEAISLLGTGRSFRSSNISSVVQEGRVSTIVSAQILTPSDTLISVGMERGRDRQRLQINHAPVQKLSEFAEQLPLQIITPDSIDLVMGSPKGRRSFLDWGMFHVEHQFLPVMKKYKKVLRQRNALLKQQVKESELHYWDRMLTETGDAISIFRKEYLEEIKQHFIDQIQPQIPLLSSLSIEFSYRRGWKEEYSLTEALTQSRERERRVAHTVVGPHEAELVIRSGGEQAKRVLSRGQAKLLAIGLYLSQLNQLKQVTGKRGVVLIDDLFSELDEENSQIIYQYLLQSGHQIFVTSAIPLPFTKDEDQIKVFHVEHGQISCG